MIDAETAAEWARQEPQRTIIATLETLQDNGHSVGELGKTMLTLALTMASKMHGPRDTAHWLYLLAQQFATEAHALENTKHAGSHGPVN